MAKNINEPRAGTNGFDPKIVKSCVDRIESVLAEIESNYPMIDSELEVGVPVVKRGGDYVFVGTIVTVFPKLSGALRCVVEDDRGILHIYSAKNLEKRGEPLVQRGGRIP